MKYSNEQMLEMYEKMVLSRVYEQTAIKLLAEGRIKFGAWHFAIGQEAAQVGCISALGPDDFYAPTHRNHGLLANKLDIKKFTAECMCKVTGNQRGKAASAHLCSTEDRVLMVNGILGAGMPIAVGIASSMKKLNKPGVVVAAIGDAASNEGNFYEAINLAGIMEAPVVFFIENNGIGFSNPIENATRAEDLSLKGVAVGIPGVTVDGNDIIAVREAMEAAIDKAKAGQPSIVEAKCVRWEPHCVGIPEVGRDLKYLEEAKKNDPIKNYEKVLKDLDLINDVKIAEIYDKSKNTAYEAFEYAISSPDPSREDVVDYSLVYKNLGGDLA